jgi:hypothetical protein
MQSLHKKLEELTHKELSPSFLFQYPTLASVKDFLGINQSEQLGKSYNKLKKHKKSRKPNEAISSEDSEDSECSEPAAISLVMQEACNFLNACNEPPSCLSFDELRLTPLMNMLDSMGLVHSSYNYNYLNINKQQ